MDTTMKKIHKYYPAQSRAKIYGEVNLCIATLERDLEQLKGFLNNPCVEENDALVFFIMRDLVRMQFYIANCCCHLQQVEK